MQNNTAEKTNVVEVSKKDLPVHCPMDDSELWCSHPRVFIPVEAEGEASCSYCGMVFKLVDKT